MMRIDKQWFKFMRALNVRVEIFDFGNPNHAALGLDSVCVDSFGLTWVARYGAFGNNVYRLKMA